MLKALGFKKRLPILTVVFFIYFFQSPIYFIDDNRSCAFAQDDKNGVLQQPDYGDAIVMGAISDARTLVPILAYDSTSGEICGMLFNGLVKYDKNINITGDLAERWEIEEDGLVIVFHLRKGVLWHDGYPFTAKDVEFTYKKLIDPQTKTPYSGDFERIKKLEVINDWTVRVTYKEPFSPALNSWAMSIMPKHLLENENLDTTEFRRKPIGTGPYQFKLWKTQEKIELVSNHCYFEKRPYIGRYIYRIIPDPATIFLELQAQGIDLTGLTPLQFSRQTNNPFFKKYYKKYNLPSFNYTYLGYNLTNPLFSDLRVRQALNYAVDKDEIIKVILLGLGRTLTGPFIPGSWAYNNNVVFVSFNPEKAKELLKEAGWVKKNNDGWLIKDGRVFEFTIVTNQANEERIKTAQIIQRRLKDIGIKVKIKVIEWSVFITEFINKRDFDAVLLGWSLGRDPDCFDIWHSSKTKEGEFNFIGYKNSEVDSLLIEARGTFDQEKRKACYYRIHEIIYEEQPCMFLYVPDSLSILHSRFQGIKPESIGIGYNFIDWWAPKNKQMYNRN